MRRILLAAALLFSATPVIAQPWRFIVSGDSRNCGDVVMPAIAAAAGRENAAFYWHLGDLRAIYIFDQEMVQEAQNAGAELIIINYLKKAWPDAIRNQLATFGTTPVYLSIGNHETITPKSRPEFIAQFADWLNAPAIQKQRLADDPQDHMLRTYAHWVQGGVDFISLDNATPDMFDDDQMKWFVQVLARDRTNPNVKAVVVGMHAALPNSIASHHSMSDTAQQRESGIRAYRELQKFRAESGKPVQILASHSHFVMSNIFDTDFWKENGGVLPGWIVGTAGAIRYRLPADVSRAGVARTDVYGYLIGTVDLSRDEPVSFAFREIPQTDIPPEVVKRYGPQLVEQCFSGNRQLDPSRP